MVVAQYRTKSGIIDMRIERFGDWATLYLARCEDVQNKIGPVDVIITDPPYKFDTSGGGKMRAERKCLEDIICNDLDQGFDKAVLNPLLYRSCIVFCHNDQLWDVIPYLHGSYHRYVLCDWIKKNPMPVANKNYQPTTEHYIHAWNRGGHPVGDLIDKKRYVMTNNGKSEYDHPTVKPDEVMDKIMRNANGDSVIDPFMGTGSTGVSAIKHGKVFIGIEKNEKYFEIACKRIENALTNKNQSV